MVNRYKRFYSALVFYITHMAKLPRDPRVVMHVSVSR